MAAAQSGPMGDIENQENQVIKEKQMKNLKVQIPNHEINEF